MRGCHVDTSTVGLEDRKVQKLRKLDLSQCTIVEHREDRRVQGRVAYSGVNGDGSFGVGWSHDGSNRTTLFRPESWKCEVVDNVIFLCRTGEDTDDFDCPWRTADLYTLIQK